MSYMALFKVRWVLSDQVLGQSAMEDVMGV